MGTGSTGARARHRVVAFQQAKLKAGARGVRRAHEERGRRDAREGGKEEKNKELEKPLTSLSRTSPHRPG